MPVFGEETMMNGELDDAMIADYNEMFSEEDFRAMGLDPVSPTVAKPGSEEKVLMLAARYASGLPLWHDSDCYDHGPAQAADFLFDTGSADDDLDDLI